MAGASDGPWSVGGVLSKGFELRGFLEKQACAQGEGLWGGVRRPLKNAQQGMGDNE